jgi:WG containing repeat
MDFDGKSVSIDVPWAKPRSVMEGLRPVPGLSTPVEQAQLPKSPTKCDNGLEIVERGKAFQLIDKSGRNVGPPQEKAPMLNCNGLTTLKDAEASVVVDKHGAVVIGAVAAWYWSGSVSGPLWIVETKTGSGLMSADGAFVIPPIYQEHSFRELDDGAIWAVLLDGRRRRLTPDGKLQTLDRIACRWEESGLIPVRQGDLWGYQDKGGNWIVEPQFEAVTCYRRGIIHYLPGLAYAAVRGRKQWCQIDKSGAIVNESAWRCLALM